jgi:hypothetical protein
MGVGLRAEQAADMHRLLASSGIALLITAVLSIVLGWLAAGAARNGNGSTRWPGLASARSASPFARK